MSALAPFEPRLFVGRVMHMRMRPRRRPFRYRVFCLWLDIDRLEETAAPLRLLALDRFGPFSFHRRDHGPRDGGKLRPWVEARLDEAGLPAPNRIMLLSMPRMLGYVFNPLSVYYCYDAGDRLSALVYEVRNTDGEMHPYALPAGPAEGGLHRQVQSKDFYVSPFIDMAMTYRFAAAAPGDRLALRIEETDETGPVLLATWSGAAEELTDARLAWRFVTHPLTTLKVIAGIYWQAVKLIASGMRPRPNPSEEQSSRRKGLFGEAKAG